MGIYQLISVNYLYLFSLFKKEKILLFNAILGI